MNIAPEILSFSWCIREPEFKHALERTQNPVPPGLRVHVCVYAFVVDVFWVEIRVARPHV